MHLVADWKAILRHAWSIRFLLLAGLLSGAEVALPLLQGLLPISPGLFAGLSLIAVAAAFVARLVAQSSVPSSASALTVVVLPDGTRIEGAAAAEMVAAYKKESRHG